MRKLFLIAALAALASGAALAQTGRRAPGFSLPDLKGNEHDLADYRGKIVVLEIFRSDCPHCARFTRILEEAITFYGGKVVVLAIANPPDTQQTVGQFVARERVTYPVLFDCGQVSYSYILPDPLHGPGVTIPHAYLIDANGMIRGDWVYGPETTDIFEGKGLHAAIDKLLAKPR